MSRSSSSFLIDWRPSRLLGAAHAVLALLAMLSLVVSSLPGIACWPAAAAISVHAIIAMHRLGRAPAQVLRIADDGAWAVLLCAGQPPRLFPKVDLGIRGPLAWLTVRDQAGRTIRWNWWPDTLPATARRQLRLASGGPIGTSAPALATMAG